MKLLDTAIPEREIMTKRPCKNCGTEIYLQYIPISPVPNSLTVVAIFTGYAAYTKVIVYSLD